MVKRNLLKILSVMVFLAGFISAQSGISVKAYTDSLDYLVGDRITYTIDVEKEEGTTIVPPLLADSLKGVELLDKLPVKEYSRDGKIIESHVYHLIGFDSTEVELGPFPVEYYRDDPTAKQSVYTEPVYFVVRTIEVDSQGDIQDVKAPVTIPFDYLIVLIIAGIVIVLAIAGYFIYRFIRKRRDAKNPATPKIVIPPHKTALKLLIELEDAKLWQKGEIKEYHSRITFIIRSYIEKRFEIPAMEVTSTELLEMLRIKNEFQVIYDKLSDFLGNADMVKFAKFEPMPSVNEEMMKQAYEFVNATKPKELLEEGSGAD